MTLSHAVDVPPATERSTEVRARIIAVLVATLWFDILHDAARHATGTSLPPWLAALAGLATQLAFTATEAALAVAAWRAAGVRIEWRAPAPRPLAGSGAGAGAGGVAAG